MKDQLLLLFNNLDWSNPFFTDRMEDQLGLGTEVFIVQKIAIYETYIITSFTYFINDIIEWPFIYV
jgi:hypothetical protein